MLYLTHLTQVRTPWQTSITIINRPLHKKDDQKTKKLDPGTSWCYSAMLPRYAPHGKRSWGPTRALIGEATTQQANDYVKVGMRNTYFYFMTFKKKIKTNACIALTFFGKKVFAMIETREAIENLDSILDLEVLTY